jgi:hypothetical protein
LTAQTASQQIYDLGFGSQSRGGAHKNRARITQGISDMVAAIAYRSRERTRNDHEFAPLHRRLSGEDMATARSPRRGGRRSGGWVLVERCDRIAPSAG